MDVLVVDPDIVGSRFLHFVFQAGRSDNLHLVSSGRDALTHIATSDVGLVIMELSLPDITGVDLCQRLRKRHFHGPIIAVSENSSVNNRIEVLDAGADDVMSKPIDPSEFLARIAAVTSRYQQDDQHPIGRSLRVGDAEICVKDMRLTIGGRPPVRLTPTEMRLMECLMGNADVAISRNTLINRTWGFDLYGDSNRLDVYIRRLRQKIERDPASPEYLVTVRSVGYAFRSHDQALDDVVDFGASFTGRSFKNLIASKSRTLGVQSTADIAASMGSNISAELHRYAELQNALD